METSEFSKPSEALAHLTAANEAKLPYSLVILDRSISGMDGFDTTVQVKQVAPEVPVIMLTSDIRAGDVQRNLAVGLSGYAVKPVRRTELLRLLSAALGPRQITEVTEDESGVSTETGAAAPLKILIAEDSEDNRLLLQLYLKGSPHRLTFAGDGKAAVERFAAERFDLVLMDLHLPVMDGLAATRAIRAIEEERGATPAVVLAVTANGRLKDVEASVSAGCNHYLWKPLSRHTLLTAIKDYKRLGAAADEGPELEPPKWVEIQMPAGLENIVPRYLISRRNEIAEMMAMLAASSFDRIAAIAHNMKGTGTSYGFPALTRMGGALERSAKQRDAGALDAQLAELKEYLGRVVLLGKH
jgi:CheY-like chemotaxis protein